MGKKWIRIVVLSVLAGTVLALTGALVWIGYREALRHAESSTRDFADLIESRIASALRRVDGDLQQLAHDLPLESLRPEAVSRYGQEWDARLDLLAVKFPEVIALRVLDGVGTLLYTSDRKSVPQASGAGREYFGQLRDDTKATLVFSDTLIGRISNKKLVVVGKALRDNQGRFQGVVYAALDVAYFEKLFSTVKPTSAENAQGASVALYRSDNFKLVARWPASDHRLNEPLPSDSPTRTALAPDASASTVRLVSATDGVARIYSYAKIPGYPFFVSVGIAESDALAGWRTNAAGFGLPILVLMIAFGLLIYRLWRDESIRGELAAVVENSNDAIFTRNLDGKILSWNAGAERMFGYPASDIIGKSSDMLIPPARASRLRENTSKLLLGEIIAGATDRVTRDGKVIAVWNSQSPVRNDDGVVVAISVTLHDISLRQQEEATRNMLAAIVESSHEAIIGRSLDRKVLSWNRAAELMFGYSADEMMGRSVSVFIPPDREVEAHMNRQQLAAGQPIIDLETVRVTKEGRRIDVSTSQSPIRNARGEQIGVALVFRDITERKRSKESIAALQSRMSAIIDSSMDAIISVDETERILIFNVAAEKLFQVRASDTVGQALQQFIPERYRKGHQAHIKRFMQGGPVVRGMGQFTKVVGLRSNGEEFPIEASISHVLTNNGHLLTVTLRDITDRVAAEAGRILLEEQLRESQKMEAIGTLAGGIAHDFNNALAAIIGNADLARYDAKDNMAVQESLQEINKAAVRARHLVQQILTFSRRQVTKFMPVHLEKVVHECSRLLRSTLPARLTLQIDCAPEIPPVLADPIQIQQALLNLATNAFQSIKKGNGRIVIRLETIKGDMELASQNAGLGAFFTRNPGMSVRLQVSDTGMGMDAETRQRIFEPFFTTKPPGEGTGLSLSVVHGIVTRHQGIITVESELGKGTAFTIYLPIHARIESSVVGDISDGAATIQDGQGCRILYVDDDEAMVRLVKRLLEKYGYRVSAFTDQMDAIDTFRSNPSDFTLVLSDYNMPGMSGLDVARAVREIQPTVAVAITSGFIDETLREEAKNAGVSELIFKADDVIPFCAVVANLALSERQNAKSI